jgi:hypothetical protein
MFLHVSACFLIILTLKRFGQRMLLRIPKKNIVIVKASNSVPFIKYCEKIKVMRMDDTLSACGR